MIVREEAGAWSLIRQMDHATHCGNLAREWRRGPYGATSVSDSLEYAAGHHDLGWTETDKKPELDDAGRPNNFPRIDEARHTEFYSGAVRTIAASDALAAYLVSLHASGLYGRRYGWAGLKPVDWTAIGSDGRALLTRERELRTQLSASIEPDQLEFESMWRSYMLLETFDFLSLLTCLGVDSPGCGPVPTHEGQWEQLSVTRLGPREVELSPFPFAGHELTVEVGGVHLARARFSSVDQLREDFAAAEPVVWTTVYRAAGR
jgi:Protein of unknown function (DUF3891)